MTTKRLALSDLDWDDVRLFLQVHRRGSISQAAVQLHIDHSTVSRRLAQLELCLGGALFERRRAGLKTTGLGHLLAAQAQVMEAAMLSLQESLTGNIGREPVGTVRIALMEGIGTMLVARHLEPLLSRHPLLNLQMVTSSSVVNVSRREADIFISFFKPEGQGLAYCPAGTFGLYLYGAPRYLQARGTPATLPELAAHTFVGYIDDLVQLDAVRWLDHLVQKPQMRFQSNSMLAQKAAASAGLGLVLLPKFSVMPEDGLVPVLAGQATAQRELWISVHHDLQYSTRIRVVMEYLGQLLLERQGWLNEQPP